LLPSSEIASSAKNIQYLKVVVRFCLLTLAY
jgi:hypothetical protein